MIFTGGLCDRFTHIVSGYSRTFSLQHREHSIFYFEYDQRKKLLAAVMDARQHKARAPLVLVGHSWGALTAMHAAAALAVHGCPADLLITVDPVSRKRMSANAATTRWININAAPATSNGWDGDYYATLGGKWGEWPADKALWHCRAPFHHNEFGALFEYAPPGGRSALECVLTLEYSSVRTADIQCVSE